MKTTIIAMLMTLTLISTFTQAAEQKYLPMPPYFSTDSDPETVLREYPLGVITRQAAFSHHGQATRSVKLPNGNEGWVYQVGEAPRLSTYTLEIDTQDRVIDVLYNERGRHNGLTALQIQSQANRILGPEVEPPPFEKHPPEDFRP